MAAMESARVMLVFEETERTPEWTLLDYNLHPTMSDFEEKIKYSFMPFASVIQLYLGKALIPSWESSRLLRDGDEVYVSMVEWKEETEPGTSAEGQWVDNAQEAVSGTSEEPPGSHKEKKKKRKKKRSHSPMETEEDGPALSKGKKGCLVRHDEEEPEVERPKKRVRLNVDLDRVESSAESGPVTESAFQNSLAAANSVNEKGDGNANNREQKSSVHTSTPVEVSQDKGKSRTSPKRRNSNPNQRLSVGMFLEALRSAEVSESATVASEQSAKPETEETEEAGSGGGEVSPAENGEVKRKKTRRARRKSKKNVKEELEVSEGKPAQTQATAAVPSSSMNLPRHKRPANVRIVFNSDSEGEEAESPQASTSFSTSPGQQTGKNGGVFQKSAPRARSRTPELQPKAASAVVSEQGVNGCNLPQRKPKPDTPMPGTAASQFKMPAPVPAAPVECRKTIGKDGVATFIREHPGMVHQLTPYPNIQKLSKAQQLNDTVTHRSIVVRNSSSSAHMVSDGASQDLYPIDQSAEALETEHNSSENLDGSYTEAKAEICEDVVDKEMDAHVRKKLSRSFDYASQEEQAEGAEEVDVDEEDEDYPSANTTFAGRTPKKIPRDYNKCPPLVGTPSPGLVIAYKVLELSTVSYTPEVSEYYEARVLCFDPTTNQVTLKPMHTTHQQPRKPGKFDLVFDDEILTTTQSEDYKVLAWSEVIGPRVVK